MMTLRHNVQQEAPSLPLSALKAYHHQVLIYSTLLTAQLGVCRQIVLGAAACIKIQHAKCAADRHVL